MLCQICTGPIGPGEPVVVYDNGLAHRFKTSCDWFIEKQAEYDEKFKKAMGITECTATESGPSSSAQ